MKAMNTTQGSTANISHTRNKFPRRVAMPFRPWTLAQCLLNECGITNRDIADESDVPLATVSRSLNIKHFKKTNFASVIKTRMAVETLLLTHEKARHKVNKETLWKDYEVAITNGEA